MSSGKWQLQHPCPWRECWISSAFLCYSGYTIETGCCGSHPDSDLILQWGYSPDLTLCFFSFLLLLHPAPHMVSLYIAHAGLRLPIVLSSGIPWMYYHAWLHSSVFDIWLLDPSSSCFLYAFSWCRCGAHPRYTLRLSHWDPTTFHRHSWNDGKRGCVW